MDDKGVITALRVSILYPITYIIGLIVGLLMYPVMPIATATWSPFHAPFYSLDADLL